MGAPAAEPEAVLAAEQAVLAAALVELVELEVPVVLGGQEPEALEEQEAPVALGDLVPAAQVEQEELPAEARAPEEARADQMV